MNRIGSVAAVLAALAAPLHAQSIDTAAVRRTFARFDTDSTPGCAVAMAGRDGRAFAGGYGMADLERGVRITPSTIFEAGSVSKQFTAAAVITLAERGKLSLDDDVRTWFPELHDYGATITIRHLLQHTSGLRDWGAIVDLEGWPRGTRTIDHRYVLAVIARQRGLNHQPGAAYSYTNSGYSLLAMLVERVSGESLAAFTRREFFDPLGMSATSWRDDYARVVRNRAQAYRPSGSGWRLDMPFENPHGHGGLLTTVGDLLTWNRALSERRVGSAQVAAIMERTGVLTSGRAITYGAGLVTDSVRGVVEIGHSGSTAGYNAHLARYPASGTSVAVLCNTSNAGATGLLRNAVAPLAGFRAQSPAAIGTNRFDNASIVLEPRNLGDYVGAWVSAEAGARWMITADSNALVIARHEGDRRTFRPSRSDEFSGGGVALRFVRDASGKVVGMQATIDRALGVPFVREEGNR